MNLTKASGFDPEIHTSPADWARMYRECGLQIVPSHLPSSSVNWKRPALADWKPLQEKLVPDATFERWYGRGGEHHQRGNMGLLTGRASGNLWVLDLDEYKPGALEWWRGVLALHNNGIEPETWQQTTGGGGRQILFVAPPDFTVPTNKTSIGVDIRGQGGFAVLPPSMHSSGKEYAWKEGFAPWEVDVADAPQWLLDAIVELIARHGGKEATLPLQPSTERVSAPPASSDLDAFGMHVDGRDHYMRDLVWAAVVNWYRECPIEPSRAESIKRMDEAYAAYLRNTKSRLPGEQSNEVKLEQEGRGYSAFQEKWHYAMRQWSGDVARAAAVPQKEKERFLSEERPPVSPSRYVFETIADLRKLPPVEYLVDGWVPEGSTGILYGKWAAGKSFIGFDLALHLAYGLSDWHGAKLPGKSVDVLIIAREGHQGFVKRIDAFKKHHSISEDSPHLIFMRGSVSFMRPEEFDALCAAIRATGRKFRFILVDTVARTVAGEDINEPKTGTLFMERIATLGAVTEAATVGVHHQNKTGGMMGSTFFEANADFVFEVSRTSAEDAPLAAGEILCTKMKDGEDRWKRSVAYEKIELGIAGAASSLVVKGITKPAAASEFLPSRATCDAILLAMKEAWNAGRPWSAAARAQDRYFVAMMKPFNIKPAAARELMDHWFANDVVAIEMYNSDSKLKGLRPLRTQP
jgi:hypothetical protein